jgi:ATP-dependent helicase/nuclease subunit B
MTGDANVFTIDAGLPFLETLARGGFERVVSKDDPLALSRMTILLPTRRAARALGNAFLKVTGQPALLMPVIRPIGDVDEDEMLFEAGADELDLSPAISTFERQLILTRLVAQLAKAEPQGVIGAASSFTQLFRLAGGLARFLDECHTQGADLKRLAGIVPERFATHWQQTLKFLEIITEHWPKILEERGALDPAQRRDQLIRTLAARWSASPPADHVIAAGSTGSIPATAELLGVIARLPKGAVVLPGLDQILETDAWNEVGPEHPQFGLKQLLGRMEVKRDDVSAWVRQSEPTPAPLRARKTRADVRQLALPLFETEQKPQPPRARLRLLSEAMRPAEASDAWRAVLANERDTILAGQNGLSRLDAEHPRAEAIAIAAIMRETLETPEATAALVTPDRGLARRVASELKRWSIDIDDSAGQPLAHTPAGLFLRHVVEVVEQDLAPVPLLALLKHPLAAVGRPREQARSLIRALDFAVMRGLRPQGGLAGISTVVEALKADNPLRGPLKGFVTDISTALLPLVQLADGNPHELKEFARAHVEATEALARESAAPAVDLWNGEAGDVASELMTELMTTDGAGLEWSISTYAQLVSELMRLRPVRPRFGRHPRLFIWGPLEARLQRADTMILGSLNEASWPPETDADPWASRPMRSELGLEQPERRVGLSAHDFVQLAANPRVYLTRALKAEGAPSTASRWLTRLQNLLDGVGAGALWQDKHSVALADALDRGAPAEPLKPPRPTPPVAARPRELSATRIEIWIRDPYAIYARFILKLEPLEAIDAAPGPRERGMIVHRVLEEFIKKTAGVLGEDAEDKLIELGARHFQSLDGRSGPMAFWWPRFLRAGKWFLEYERKRRGGIVTSFVEAQGRLTLHGPAGPFKLRAKADRIDVLKDGSIAILDYKTGQPPTKSQIESGLSPQLPLEALIAGGDGFGKDLKRPVSVLAYVQFTGGTTPGTEAAFNNDIPTLIAEADRGLLNRIAQFDQESTPYLSRPHIMKLSERRDYDHLARAAEWASSGEGGE